MTSNKSFIYNRVQYNKEQIVHTKETFLTIIYNARNSSTHCVQLLHLQKTSQSQPMLILYIINLLTGISEGIISISTIF